MAEQTNNNEIFLKIGQLEGKTNQSLDLLRSLDKRLADMVSASETRHEAMQDRLSTLEQGRAKLMGGGAVIGAFLSLIVEYFAQSHIWR